MAALTHTGTPGDNNYKSIVSRGVFIGLFNANMASAIINCRPNRLDKIGHIIRTKLRVIISTTNQLYHTVCSVLIIILLFCVRLLHRKYNEELRVYRYCYTKWRNVPCTVNLRKGIVFICSNKFFAKYKCRNVIVNRRCKAGHVDLDREIKQELINQNNRLYVGVHRL